MKTAIFINTFVKMNNYDLSELKEPGLKLVAFVKEPDLDKFKSSYGQEFDDIHVIPCRDNPTLNDFDYDYASQLVKKEIESGREVKIICQSEDNMLLAAKLRDAFNISGLSYELTLRFRDKLIMKEMLQKAGIRVPRFRSVLILPNTDIADLYRTLVNEFGLPFIVKPTMLLGANGVKIIHDEKAFNAFYLSNPSTAYEVEEFIQGKLYHCDTIRYQGKSAYSVCCEYTHPNLDFQKGKNIISLPLQMTNPLVKRMTALSNEILTVLALENGVSHMEFFVTDTEEIIFLEVGARCPGAVATPMYKQAFGINFENIAFNIEMHQAFKIEPQQRQYFMSGLIPVCDGIVTKCNEPRIQSEYQLNWYVKEGDVLSVCGSLRDKAASIFVWNDSFDALYNDFEYLRKFQALEMK